MNTAAETKFRYILFHTHSLAFRGGVADYTDNFAQHLMEQDKLLEVVSPLADPNLREYKVSQFKIKLIRSASGLDKWYITRKMRTLGYFIQVYYRGLTGLRKLMRKQYGARIIFTEYYTKPFDIIIYCARFLGIKYSIIFHGMDLLNARSNGYFHFIGNLRGADFIIFNSHATATLCREIYHFESKRYVILYPGIDIELIERNLAKNYVGRVFERNSDNVVFVTISRLVERKGIDIAIRIVHKLAKKYKVKYFIGGVGAEEKALEKLISDLGARDYIFLLGSVTDQEKYRLLQDSDIYILPTNSAHKSDFEGFGISFIEASLFGKVVVGGNHGGVSEAVVDGCTGFLLDFDNPGAVDSAIEILTRVIESPQLRSDIGLKGRAFVRSHFTWKSLIQIFNRFEQDVLH